MLRDVDIYVGLNLVAVYVVLWSQSHVIKKIFAFALMVNRVVPAS